MSEQVGGRYDICFQETRVSGFFFDISTKQGGKESPRFFNMMMKWSCGKVGVSMRLNEGQRDECWSPFDLCCVKRMMFEETTEKVRKRGLDWKEDHM